MKQLSLALAVLTLTPETTAQSTRSTTVAEATTPSGLPVLFVENQGQLAPPAFFEARVPGMRLQAERAALRFEFASGAHVRIAFEGASRTARPTGVEESGAAVHYLRGPSPAGWILGVPAWFRLRTSGLYPGVDLEIHEGAGRLEYDLILAPGADLGDVRLRCEGHQAMTLADDGALVITTAGGELVHEAPLAWQIGPDGSRHDLHTSYRLLEGGRFALDVQGRDPRLFTVVDPVVAYTTYVGGSSGDEVADVEVDALGMVYATGWSGSGDFPVTSGVLSEQRANEEAVVFKLDESGALVWATYVGGARAERGLALTVADSGEVVVAGRTSSTDFPTTARAFARTKAAGMDAFVLKLAADGSSLVWSTFLGGAADDEARAVELDDADFPCVAGVTRSANFPANGLQGALGGERDAFVSKLATDGSALVFSTYLGGKKTDEANALAVDDFGAVYVAGRTSSTDFPTTPGAYDEQKDDVDAFLVKLNATGASLSYGTFLGGRDEEEARGLALDGGYRAHVVGSTRSSDFPVTSDALISEWPAGRDGFYAVLSATGSGLVYGTYVGGSGRDECLDVALDAYGSGWVVGRTSSDDFPVTPDALLATRAGAEDAFVVELDAQRSFRFGTYLGGPGDDRANAVAIEPFLRTSIVVGAAKSGLPTTQNALSAQSAGGVDGFVTRLNHGFCGEPARVHVLARGCGASLSGELPRLGKATSLNVTGAPPLSEGFLLISPPGAAPRNVGPGCDVFIDLSSYEIMVSFITDANGAFSYPLHVISHPSQCGLAMVIQGAVVSGGGPLSFGALTDALLVILGD